MKAKLRAACRKLGMILALGTLAGAGIECDLKDGELEIDLDGFHLDDRDYHHHDDFYYEEVFFDPWF